MVRVAVYRMAKEFPIARALDELRERNDDVKLILDNTQEGTANDAVNNETESALVNGFPSDGSVLEGNFAASDIIRCSACVNRSSGIMHNKFIVIDKPGGGDVVMQTSMNFRYGSEEQFQNLVIVKGLERAADLYRDYWWSMSDRTWRGEFATQRTVLFGGGGALHVYPRDGDNLAGKLEGTTCWNTSRVWGSSPLFQDRAELRKQMARLDGGGKCDVRYIGSSPAAEDYAEEPASGNAIGRYRAVTVGQLHDKILLLDAPIDGVRRYVTIVGSHNFGPCSLLKCDEAMLQIQDRAVFQRFACHYARMFNRNSEGGRVTCSE